MPTTSKRTQSGLKEAATDRQLSRKRSLRPFYESLKISFSDSFLPLFIDFLLLSSVKPLWQDDSNEENTIDDSAWKLLLPLIKSELEEYHLESISSAVRLILSTNDEFKTEEDLEDAVDEILEGDLDSFFNLATSLLVCDGGCQASKKFVSRISYWGYGCRRRFQESQTGFVGSLQEIIAHQQQEHNGYLESDHDDDSDLSAKEKKRIIPAYRFSRSLEVACAILALLEVGQLDEDVATSDDLDSLDSGYYRWDNSRTKNKYFDKWRELVRTPSSRLNMCPSNDPRRTDA